MFYHGLKLTVPTYEHNFNAEKKDFTQILKRKHSKL